MLNETQENLLDANIKRRELMLANLFSKEEGFEISPDVKNMRIANEIMTAQEVAILKSAEIEAREQNAGDLTEAIKEMIQQANKPMNKPFSLVDRELDKELEFEVNEYELKEYKEELELSNFVKEDSEEDNV